ncbi:hypothetical protein HPB49_022208 [Dermacentor silvarum]|uniref:Uncharacterized protein n=1 Tax=Dermacentor silvarum TaxID=543639 RepID=A0ACB8CBK3_DERSI|nr:hypothetical protein HPB49_022208 [Dermacentor silvarum]
MHYLALVLSIIGGTVFLALLLAAICSYYWISQRHYPCAWSATADAKSDVYYKKTGDWKYVQNGTVPDAEEGVVTDNDEPLLGSIVPGRRCERNGTRQTVRCRGLDNHRHLEKGLETRDDLV